MSTGSLVPSADATLSFMAAVNGVDLLGRKPVLRAAVVRYHKFMSLLAAASAGTEVDTHAGLCATRDIEAVWQAHLIRTKEYRAFCHRLCGRTLPHVVVDEADTRDARLEATRVAWAAAYGTDDYFVEADAAGAFTSGAAVYVCD